MPFLALLGVTLLAHLMGVTLLAFLGVAHPEERHGLVVFAELVLLGDGSEPICCRDDTNFSIALAPRHVWQPWGTVGVDGSSTTGNRNGS